VSNPDDSSSNDLTRIADGLPHLLVAAKAGETSSSSAGHILQRSKK